MAEVALNLEDVFLFFFDNVGVCTCYRRVLATTLLALLVPKTSLVVLVFFASLALMGGRLLVLAIAERVSVDLVFLKFFSSFFVGLFPWVYFESIFRVSKGDWSNVFTFILMVFSTASF